MLKVKLTRDLRKNILRGHPWIYREAIQASQQVNKACLCEVLDKKGKTLAWAIYSPQGPLALRIISVNKKPPNKKLYEDRLFKALQLRKTLLNDQNNCFRLINGEGDSLPGFVCDIYNHIAVIQFDGLQCFEFWDQDWLAQWLLENLDIKSVYFKPRKSDSIEPKSWGEGLQSQLVTVTENAKKFLVNYVDGQKTGFFLDQRDNRSYLGSFSEGQKVLNLFSYTGGFSIYAGAGGANQVTSVDLSGPALELADKAWLENGFAKEKHSSVCIDVFEFVNKTSEVWDIVMVDPPSMTHSEKNKSQAKKSYSDLFAQSAHLVAPGKHLVLSSCSSHISFQDFFEIIDEALSQVRRTGKILKVSGQGVDHPFPHYCHELRYLKFVHLVLN